jgi:hypothetical protein
MDPRLFGVSRVLDVFLLGPFSFVAFRFIGDTWTFAWTTVAVLEELNRSSPAYHYFLGHFFGVSLGVLGPVEDIFLKKKTLYGFFGWGLKFLWFLTKIDQFQTSVKIYSDKYGNEISIHM